MADPTSRGKQVVEDIMDLPPGFRFHPTDEEIITHYLLKKVSNPGFTSRAMGEVDLNKWEPWELSRKAKMREEWYFFCQNDWKYPTGTRANRATKDGYWKATGKDKEIYKGRGILVGLKKTLVFYRGRAPRGEKTDWVIHEFRVAGTSQQLVLTSRTTKCEWVVCKVFQKSTAITRRSPVQVEDMPTMNYYPNDSALLDTVVGSSYVDNVLNGCRPNSSFANNAEASSSRGRPRNNISINNLGTDQILNSCYSDTKSHVEDDPIMFILQNPYSSPPGHDNMVYLHLEPNMANPVAALGDELNGIQGVDEISRNMNNQTSSTGYGELSGAFPAGFFGQKKQ